MLRIIARTTLLGIAAVAPFAAGAQPLVHMPGVHRYRLVTDFAQKQEMMGVAAEVSAKSTQVVTVTLAARAKDTLTFTIAIDSFEVALSEPVPREALPNYRGLTLSGSMSPSGRIYDVKASTDTMPEVLKEYRNFFVTLPADARSGRPWVDTLVVPLEMRGLNFGTATMITTSRVVGDTIYAGARAWKIERTAVGSGSGAVDQTGMEMTLRMSTSATGTIYFGIAGAQVGSTGTATSTVTVSVPAQNISLPITQRMSNKTTLVSSSPPR
jgi:hypothetical protein